MTERHEPTIRAVTDEDADGLIGLIGAAYDEHPGCVLDLPGVDADLPAPATAAARRGGRWWVVTDGERLVASVGTGPVQDDGSLELKRLYVAASHRRRGLARTLVDRVHAHAAGLGATTLELWSDTRFTDAHRLYADRGYTDTGQRRRLHDPSDTTEVRFRRPVEASRPRRRIGWRGPFGAETCEVHDLPDGVALRGHVEEPGAGYVIEVDHDWRTRTATVTDPTGTRRLATDGAGRWWTDGREVDELAGCLDVDVEASPVTNTLPIRRLLAARERDAEIRAAWVRVPGPAIEASPQRYEQLGARTWRYRSGTFAAELTVDDDALVVAYGDVWSRS